MTDQIEISALRVVAIVGALPHEREIAQPLQIDLTLDVDLADAGRSDDLDDTVHYGLVADQVVALVQESKDTLLERLAARVADEVLTFDRVEAVTVLVTKLRPPIAVDAASTAVRIRRTRATAAAAPQSPHRAFIALGSNLGDREEFLRMGVAGSTGWSPCRRCTRPTRSAAPTIRARTSTWSSRSRPRSTRSPCCVAVSGSRRSDAPTGRALGSAHARRRHHHVRRRDHRNRRPRRAAPALRRAAIRAQPLAEIAPERCPAGWDERLEPAGITAAARSS